MTVSCFEASGHDPRLVRTEELASAKFGPQHDSLAAREVVSLAPTSSMNLERDKDGRLATVW